MTDQAPPSYKPGTRNKTQAEAQAMLKGFGERIKAARLEAGYATVTEAASKMGITRQQWNKFEWGLRSPSMDTLNQMVSKLGFNPWHLFPREESEPIE